MRFLESFTLFFGFYWRLGAGPLSALGLAVQETRRLERRLADSQRDVSCAGVAWCSHRCRSGGACDGGLLHDEQERLCSNSHRV